MAWDQLLGFFSPEAGQARRQWLNRQEANVGNALRHYLGPAAQPIQSAAMLAGYMSPGADMMEAADASRGMWNADNPLDAAVAGATMLGATGMMFLPGNFNALREGIGSVADDMAAAYDPALVRAGPLPVYHGSPAAGIDTLRPSTEGGALGPGVYGTPFRNVAERYAGDQGQVYEFTADNFFNGLGRNGVIDENAVNLSQMWNDETGRVIANLPEHMQSEMTVLADRYRPYRDGYAFFRELAYRLGSKEAAQDVFRRAGFDGLSAYVDGPEVVMFGPQAVGQAQILDWLDSQGL